MNTLIFVQEVRVRENSPPQFVETSRLNRFLVPRMKERVILNRKKFVVAGIVYDYDENVVTVVLRQL